MAKLEDELQQKNFTDDSQRLAVNIMYTFSWLNTMNIQRLKPFGLSPQQYNILRILRGQHPQPVTVNLLKERMLDKMSNASRLVEKLRTKGLLERRTCPDDRRAVDVLITEKGLTLLAQIERTEVIWEAKFKQLSAEDINILNELLDRLRG